jgi:2-haloacid dehalogenase
VIEESHPHLSYKEVMRRALGAGLADAGVSDADGQLDILARTMPSWPIFPDVSPALTALRKAGWSLAILSNVDNDLLSATVKRIAVEFDLTVTAEDAGSYKPALGHFHRFRELSQTSAEQWIHVAVSVYHDINPAATLGVRGVYVPRDSAREDCGQAFAMLPDLRALPALLQIAVP